MAKGREVEMDAGDPQFFSRSEFQHLFPRLRCSSWINIVGDARIGEGELDARKVHDVPQMSNPSPLDTTSHAVWPGVWPGVGKARTPGATWSVFTVRTRSP